MSGNAILAGLPLASVLALMLLRRWSSARAGAVGLAVSIAVGALWFGLTPVVLLVSQARGIALAGYVLYIIWAALLLYHVVGEVGGIRSLQVATSALVPDRAAALLYAWCLSGVLEGIAGFGVPLAAVAPLLVGLGVSPVLAVAATAVGHAWSVTFGDMGVVYQALLAVVDVPAAAITPAAALLLGLVCIVSGWVVAAMLGLRGGRRFAKATAVGLAMAGVQAIVAIGGPAPLAAFAGGVAGLAVGVVLFGRRAGSRASAAASGLSGLAPYLLAALLMALPSLIPPLAVALSAPVTAVWLPAVTTSNGWATAAGSTKPLQWLLHPGTVMLATLLVTAAAHGRGGRIDAAGLRRAWSRTRAVAVPTSIGVTCMIGIAMVMDHTGMTQGLARAAADAMGGAYPILSAPVGLLGALATGSNTSSNVLFGPLQQGMAGMLGLSPGWLLAAQTAGGALGSMVAPAKLVLGCAAVGLVGGEGEVLRRTGPAALGMSLLVGVVALALA